MWGGRFGLLLKHAAFADMAIRVLMLLLAALLAIKILPTLFLSFIIKSCFLSVILYASISSWLVSSSRSKLCRCLIFHRLMSRFIRSQLSLRWLSLIKEHLCIISPYASSHFWLLSPKLIMDIRLFIWHERHLAIGFWEGADCSTGVAASACFNCLFGSF